MNVPPDIAVADPTSTLSANGDAVDYALGRSHNMGPWLTPATQQREHVRYLLVLWGLINKGSGPAACPSFGISSATIGQGVLGLGTFQWPGHTIQVAAAPRARACTPVVLATHVA